ncbi:MAG TPA: 16S rRNA (cytosine(1402)-N(4))-methyltransferase RsmH [Fimbriimonadaceae bacterium]|nr:16S rRNA (cytosine(1402)-N(4))-methyltransferase RsmH [Fimbriimonadaceae bacterium]
MTHVPVMPEEVLAALHLRPGAFVVDGTVGHGGHARLMAAKIAPGGVILGLDWDLDMLATAKARLEGVEGVEVELRHTDYRGLPKALAEVAASKRRAPYADAILLDLGLNLAQIESPDRGISFRVDAPLDMRMNRTSGEPASALLNRASPEAIEDALFRFGDERWARRIAHVIVERRRTQPLRTTQDLVDCVLAAIPVAKREKRIHPATRTFQAVRIWVNRELDGLDEALAAAARCLAPRGVLAVLSFHSGEDRIVKHTFRDLAEKGFEELYKKPLTPTESEIAVNPKSRSTKLRALRRTEEPQA